MTLRGLCEDIHGASWMGNEINEECDEDGRGSSHLHRGCFR